MQTKLTRAEIDAMTLPQLRLAVAEHIFGIEAFVVDDPRETPFIHREFLMVGECYWTKDNHQEVLPDYSGDIGAAMLIVDKFADEGVHYQISHHISDTKKRYAEFGGEHEQYEGYGGVMGDAIEDTMPMAICRAALYYYAALAAESESQNDNR